MNRIAVYGWVGTDDADITVERDDDDAYRVWTAEGNNVVCIVRLSVDGGAEHEVDAADVPADVMAELRHSVAEVYLDALAEVEAEDEAELDRMAARGLADEYRRDCMRGM